jgi:hypothetical protein
MREDSYHHNDDILNLGEISDRMFFVSKGKVAIYVNETAQNYSSLTLKTDKIVDKEDKQKRRERKREERETTQNQSSPMNEDQLILLGYLNVGSNFNHLSAILSQQSILTFKAMG